MMIRRTVYQAARCFLLATGLLWSFPPFAAPLYLPDVAATYLVVYRSDVDPDSATNDLAAKCVLKETYIYRYAIKGTAMVVPLGQLAALQRDPRVAYVEADQVFHAHAQSLPTGVDRINADFDPLAHINGVDGCVGVDFASIDYVTSHAGEISVSIYFAPKRHHYENHISA